MIEAKNITMDYGSTRALDSVSFKIDEKEIVVRFQKRAHNPLLLAAGFHESRTRVTWLGGKFLSFIFG